MSQPIFYVNGEFTPAEHAALPLNDLGIVRGYGVFDFWRTYDGTPFHQREHLQRFARSAAQIDLALPWTEDELNALVNETVARNGFANAGIRIIATGGPAPDYMSPQGNPSLVIMVKAVPAYQATNYSEGCRAITKAMIRERPTVKSLNYIGAIMAVEEAKRRDATEALYLTADGCITEGTRSNFFLVKGGELITPAEGVLDGITRMAVLKLAPARLPTTERAVHISELADADEVFITSSTKELLPIVQIDDLVIGDGRPGPVTLTLLDDFRAYALDYHKSVT
ncbi:MAG: aminotransferase class IV [Caldilineaceae bacterium]|nr:aminotransferase class IV [Caldilineaceae bacterium]